MLIPLHISECPLQLSCFGFLLIQSGRCSNDLRHFEASTSQLKYSSDPKMRLLRTFPCSDKSEFFSGETSECPLQLSRFECLLIRSGRGSTDSNKFGASANRCTGFKTGAPASCAASKPGYQFGKLYKTCANTFS